MIDLIDLQSAHVTQMTNNGVKGDWSVQKNITNEELFRLSPHHTEDEVFEILDFARKFELLALNAGIEFQKGKQNAVLKAENDKLKADLKFLADENEKLATALDNSTKGI